MSSDAAPRKCDSFGPWLQLENYEGLFARFKYTDKQYSLQLTDLIHVWSEDLVDRAITDRRRHCECPVELRDHAEISRFGDFLSKLLASAKVVFDHEKAMLPVVLSRAAMGKEISFSFELRKVDAQTTSKVLKDLILDLFGVVRNAGSQIRTLEQTIYEKDYHIRAMADAVSRSTAYVPRRYQRSYDEAFDPASKTQFVDLPRLLQQFWPAHEPKTLPEPSESNAPLPESPIASQPRITEQERLERRADLKKITISAKRSRLM